MRRARGGLVGGSLCEEWCDEDEARVRIELLMLKLLLFGCACGHVGACGDVGEDEAD